MVISFRRDYKLGVLKTSARSGDSCKWQKHICSTECKQFGSGWNLKLGSVAHATHSECESATLGHDRNLMCGSLLSRQVLVVGSKSLIESQYLFLCFYFQSKRAHAALFHNTSLLLLYSIFLAHV